MQADATRLMTAAKQGDREAFDRLVESLRGQAFRLAVSLVGSREDAMELSQEAFLKTYRARASYRDGEPFLPWFHRILRNCCYSFLRKRGRLRKTSLSARAAGAEDEGDWEIADEGPAPHDAVLADERAQLFWRAFRTLSARDREILTLRHFQELSYQEIADTLSIPIGTVMSRLFHARRRLRETLGDLLEPEDAPAAAPRTDATP
jgi:RNA polymerase sigma-70 factor (ECF subfamily)